MTQISLLRTIPSALFLMVCAMTSPASAQKAAEPEAIVKSFYEAVMTNTDGGFGVNDEDRKILTKSLRKLWNDADMKVNPKGEDVGAIDFDIVSLSQDPNVSSYSVKTEKRDERSASIAASFTIGPQNIKSGKKEVVRYDFLREDGEWKVDNVRAVIEKKPWSLRGSLQESLKN